ncbi:sulfotransferase [Fulvivirga imtechensis AK7]|uniref:Sulfotransferase n=1 Tax=Fulvivirga imtechensis AK7 TaxID=1237149 RepID=L8JSP2_9BACT|nr:sulfotransferase [Fulvivirga imtechensis]ELR71213.1 sulfotransferase [Fulvivirga imtechensis AK7]
MTRLIQKSVNVSKRIFFRMEKWLYYNGWLEPSRLVLPDFLCIGSQKAGTTWLYENLRQHPDLFLPDRKELNYFSSKYRFFGMPLSAYSHYFQEAKGMKGEITPYENLPVRRIRFIKKIIPSLKLILIIRNPVDRMWASVLMYLVSAQKKQFEDISDKEFTRMFHEPDLFSRGDYPAILKNWRSVFPENQLHICFYDDLVSHPKQFLRDIFVFLEVSTEPGWSQFPVENVFNKSPEYPCPQHLRNYLKNMYYDSLKKLSQEFPHQTEKYS